MGHYTYKDARELLPEGYVEAFEAKYKREYDWDGNYDGDQWIAVADYIEELQEEIKQLKGIK